MTNRKILQLEELERRDVPAVDTFIQFSAPVAAAAPCTGLQTAVATATAQLQAILTGGTSAVTPLPLNNVKFNEFSLTLNFTKITT